MTSTSSEPVVLRDLPDGTVLAADVDGDLRTGRWTRHGSGRVLGDPATESALQHLAERTHRVARAQGYAAGWAEGRRVADERAATAERDTAARTRQVAEGAVAQQRLAAAALERAAADARDAFAALHADLAEQAVAFALELAEQVVGRELATAADPGADAIRRAVAGLAAEPVVAVRLHPDDLAALDRGVLGAATTYVADPTLARGDAVVETDTGFVDATVRGALDRAREVLGQ
ncbi:MAG: FliH/SctL family protein [Nocardioidaceae bacterium]